MPRYIDAEMLRENICPWVENTTLVMPVQALDDAPTADVVEVKRGEWKIPTTIGGRAFNVPHCSVCNGIPCGVDENTKYCPNCGAEMKGAK